MLNLVVRGANGSVHKLSLSMFFNGML